MLQKYCIKIEKATMNFLSSTQAEYICKEWLLFETVLGVWNFSAVLHNVCLDNLNVYCLCKYAGHMFCMCTLLCFSLQINKLQKKVCSVMSGVCSVMSGVCSVMSGVCSVMSGVCSVMSGVCSAMSGVCSVMSGQSNGYL